MPVCMERDGTGGLPLRARGLAALRGVLDSQAARDLQLRAQPAGLIYKARPGQPGVDLLEKAQIGREGSQRVRDDREGGLVGRVPSTMYIIGTDAHFFFDLCPICFM